MGKKVSHTIAKNVKARINKEGKLILEIDLNNEQGYSESGSMINIAHAHWAGIPDNRARGVLVHMHVGRMAED